jgi:phosphomannomutase
MSLTEQLDELYNRVGKLESGKIGVKLTAEVAAKLKEKLAQEPSEIGGKKIDNINRTDGVKFIFADESWMLMRPSGTEPLVRIYAEAENKEVLEVLIEQGRRYLLG